MSVNFTVVGYTKRTTPHPVLLPMGEGTPELSAAGFLAFPLPLGEGQGEG